VVLATRRSNVSAEKPSWLGTLEAAVWHDMFVEQIPLFEKVFRTVAVYALIAVLFRLTGKRGLANLNTFDFIVVFLLSNIVQNAVIGADNSLIGGVIGAVTLVVLNGALNQLLARSTKAARIFEGMPTLVIRDGHVIGAAIRKLGLRRTEIEHAVRLQNADSVGQIQRGTLNSDGQLLLTLKENEQSATKADIAALTAQLARIEQLVSGKTV
jgi:uncharacterized membrane protein YcaP (DUF421 family)